MELKTMGVTTDFNKNEFVRDAIRDAVRDSLTNLLRRQLTTKFGSLPKWAEERLEKATQAQLERWFKKILTAETLVSVLGKK